MLLSSASGSGYTIRERDPPRISPLSACFHLPDSIPSTQHSIAEEECYSNSSKVEIGNTCSYCRSPRRPVPPSQDPSGINVPMEADPNELIHWFVQNTIDADRIDLPFDVVCRMLVLDEERPTMRGEPATKQAFMSSIYDDPLRSEWESSPLGPFPDKLPFHSHQGRILDALYGRGPAITSSIPADHKYPITTKIQWPEGWAAKAIINLLPSLPSKYNSIYRVSIFKCTSTVLVLDLIDVTVEVLDQHDQVLLSGIPSYVYHGGIIPIARIEIRSQTKKSKGHCACSTSISIRPGALYNNPTLFGEVTDVPVPETYSFNNILTSTIFKSVLGAMMNIARRELSDRIVEMFVREVAKLHDEKNVIEPSFAATEEIVIQPVQDNKQQTQSTIVEYPVITHFIGPFTVVIIMIALFIANVL